MKTVKELNSDILEISMKIEILYPELSKFIVEMPISDTFDSEINVKDLKNYYDSLDTLFNDYAKDHVSETI